MQMKQTIPIYLCKNKYSILERILCVSNLLLLMEWFSYDGAIFRFESLELTMEFSTVYNSSLRNALYRHLERQIYAVGREA
jgi:hypothetical protein